MRSALALALSALLLLLLPPQPSLSEEAGDPVVHPPTVTTEIKDTSSSKPTPAMVSPSGTVPVSATAQTTVSSSSSVTPGDSKTLQASSPPSTTAKVENPDKTPEATTGSQASQVSGKATPPMTTVQPEAITNQNGSKATAGPGAQSSQSAATTVAAKDTSQSTPQPTTPPTSTVPASVPSTVPTSSQLPTSGILTSEPPKSSSQEPSKTTAAVGHADTPTVPTFTSQGTSATPALMTTSPDNLQPSRKTPASPGTTSSVTGTPSNETSQPSLGSETTTSGREPISTTIHLPSTASSDSSPSPTSAFVDNRIKCEPPERLNENVLVLNLTNTNLCAGSPPDDKLITLLCRAAKATFNPAQDQCHIRLAPIPEIQALAIKEITIETTLLPQDVYELLKNKWDDLKEVGVNNMQLGDQGPPEETEDRFSMPLIITIVCMASFLLLVAALYGCCHQRLSQRKDQQRLTEELQTVENGYHDNPTLEVMETSSEMQEKKVVNLNGELGDSWIVPLDNLIKDDLDEEEDTHL